MKKIRNYSIFLSFLTITFFLLLIFFNKNKKNFYLKNKISYSQLLKKKVLNEENIIKYIQESDKSPFLEEHLLKKSIIKKIIIHLKQSLFFQMHNIDEKMLKKKNIIKNCLYYLSLKIFTKYNFYNFDMSKINDLEYMINFWDEFNILNFAYMIKLPKESLTKRPLAAFFKQKKNFYHFLRQLDLLNANNYYETTYKIKENISPEEYLEINPWVAKNDFQLEEIEFVYNSLIESAFYFFIFFNEDTT
ncbi:hypothetical protein AXA84_0368 [Candidatus Phytoplasma oryzae]|uniref:Uncharacterized protein n=3 Tax=Candidatus Phytoplasma oryzae TaxID=203274 RepID=A0A139JQ54_9MOLU|nr:hypothetical protein [Candidatus Phytoplasma oryzae]KXT29107.1 hypothetical protein AXA84_0368 [Candidatus Phytoplasma oryzae]